MRVGLYISLPNIQREIKRVNFEFIVTSTLTLVCIMYTQINAKEETLHGRTETMEAKGGVVPTGRRSIHHASASHSFLAFSPFQPSALCHAQPSSGSRNLAFGHNKDHSDRLYIVFLAFLMSLVPSFFAYSTWYVQSVSAHPPPPLLSAELLLLV
jgi:hypothetical protein